MLARTCLIRTMGILALFISLLSANTAQAYVPPDPGVIGYFASLIAWMLLIFSSVLLWPIHAFLRRWRRGKADAAVEPAPVPTAEESANAAREPS